MVNVRLKIDIAGTIGDGAWKSLRQFPEAVAGQFGPDEGAEGPCRHLPSEPHRAGEWWGAVISVENHLLAEYAMSHYLEQGRVMDVYLDER